MSPDFTDGWYEAGIEPRATPRNPLLAKVAPETIEHEHVLSELMEIGSDSELILGRCLICSQKVYLSSRVVAPVDFLRILVNVLCDQPDLNICLPEYDWLVERMEQQRQTMRECELLLHIAKTRIEERCLPAETTSTHIQG